MIFVQKHFSINIYLITNPFKERMQGKMKNLIKIFELIVFLTALIIPQEKPNNDKRLIILPDGKVMSGIDGSIISEKPERNFIKQHRQLDSHPIGTPFSWDNNLNFNSATFNSINAIVVSGSDVYIGGDFTNAMFIGANYIIRWNQKNNTWHTVGVGNELNGPVRAIAVSGNDVYVGGEFTDAGGNLNSDYIARWDGNSWNSLGSGTGLNNFVNAIAISGNDVYIGGDFTSAGGLLEADHIVKWDGSSWNAIGQLNGTVYAIEIFSSEVFIGGAFTSGSGNSPYFVVYDGLNVQWYGLGSTLNGAVYAIDIDNTKLYIGGEFTNAGGDNEADVVALFDLYTSTEWQAIGTSIIKGDNYPNIAVRSLAAFGDDLYVAGEFWSPYNSDFNGVAYWNGTSWDSLDTGLFGPCRALALSGTDLLAGSDGSSFTRWFGAYTEGLFSALQLPAVSGAGLVEFNSLNDSTRITINLVQSGYGNGIYNVYCYESKPVAVGGSILALANHRWIIKATGLAVSNNFIDEIRIKFSDFPDSSGIINPNIVKIFYRPTPGRGNFSELLTTYDSNTNELWAYINNVYGEYAIGLPNTIDGIISSNEYGSHVEGENMLTSDGKTWYMRSDDYYFYFGISNYTNENDAVNIYLDNSGISPVNYHDYYYGTQTGTGKDGLNTNLPFGAEFFAYVKPSYDEYRHTDQLGGWMDSVSNSFIKSYNDAEDVFEFAIPISSLPVSTNIYNYPLDWFNWLGFLSNSGNISSRVPLRPNPSGILNDLVWYFGADTYSPSFSINCYTHIGPSISNFGAINCSEFTFNPQSPTIFINRTSGVWNIEGDLWVYNGTLTFQNSDSVNVGGFLTAGGTTNFSYNTSDAPLNLKYFLWQWEFGGTINMDSGHILTFVDQTFGQAYFDCSEVFQNIVVNNPYKVYLRSDMKINQSLTLLNGNIQTITHDTFYVRTNQGAIVTRPGIGYVEGYLVRWANSGIVDFPVGTSNGYSPVSFNFSNVTNPNTITVAAFQNVHPNVITPAQSMQRYWKIKKDSALTFTNTSINFQYLPEDFNTEFFELTDESTMVVGKYDASWSFPTISARNPGGVNDGGNITISGITSFSDFTMAKSETALPVELTSFTASVINNSVLLNWTTATELNNYGFEIERTVQTSMALPLNELKWEKIGFVAGSGNSDSPKNYSFTDGSLVGGSKFKYRLKQIDNDGTFNYSNEINVEVVPIKFDLAQNYPNPFNPNTKIRYSIPDVGLGFAQTVLKVYDILGNEVATLVNEEKPAGVYEVEYNASNLSSGIYFYRITIQSDKADAGKFSEIKKMILIK